MREPVLQRNADGEGRGFSVSRLQDDAKFLGCRLRLKNVANVPGVRARASITPFL